MKFKLSNLLEWNFKPEIKIGIKTIKTEIKTIILKSEWKLKRNKIKKKRKLFWKFKQENRKEINTKKSEQVKRKKNKRNQIRN